METVLIAGGTGLIGKKLSSILAQKGYHVRVLSRKRLKTETIEYFYWDVPNHFVDENAFKNIDHLINLAGTNIGSGRWTKIRKKEILDSRFLSTQLLYETVKKLNIPLKSFISSSAVGYYGAINSDKIFVETDIPANDFLGNVCQKWEEASLPFLTMKIRTLQIRTGVVLDKEDGAFPKMFYPIKIGIGSALGTGKQIIPWIHLHDICNIYLFALQNEKLVGAYNAVAPQPVNNKEFTEIIAKKINKKIWLPAIPSFVLKWVLGEMSDLVLLGSNVSSQKIIDSGFTFQYATVHEAVDSLL